jgi:dinuclear metal center YbgI/SA1388 family protein
MVTVSAVLDALAVVAPFSKAARWDAVGLQVGDPAASAERVAVCHEVTNAVVDDLSRDPVDLIVAYQPLLFHPTRALVAGPSPAGRAFRLAAMGTALAVVHTAFDVVEGGTADALAGVLGLENTHGFGPAWGPDTVKVVTFVPAAAADLVERAMADAGAGRIGAYSGCSFRMTGVGSFLPGPGARPTSGDVGSVSRVEEERLEMIAPATTRDAVVAALVAAHPYQEPAFDVLDVAGNAGMAGRVGTVAATTTEAFAARVGRSLDAATRYSGSPDRPVGRVAVVPGSGSSFLQSASGIADVLVTGDVSHHDAAAALDAGLSIIDAGHIPSERPGIDALYAAVSRIARGAVRIEDDPHPWKGM